MRFSKKLDLFGDEVFAFFNQKRRELEAQGAYTSLKPGESLSWTSRWYLLPQDTDNTPSAELMNLVCGIK